MLGLLKRSQYSHFAEVKLRAHKMQSFCVDTEKFPEGKEMHKGFQGKDMLPINEHLDASRYGVTRSNLPIRRIEFADSSMLRQEFRYLKAAAEELERTSIY